MRLEIWFKCAYNCVFQRSSLGTLLYVAETVRISKIACPQIH